MKQLKNNMLKLYESAFDTYDKGKELIKIKNILNAAAEQCFWNHAKKNYWIINFNSPAGEESEDMLNAIGIMAIWNGTPGYRGNTTVFLPKSRYKEVPDIKAIIKTMARLDNRYDDLNYLFDDDSTIEVED